MLNEQAEYTNCGTKRSHLLASGIPQATQRQELHAGKGLRVAATDGAKQQLVALQQEEVATLEAPEESAATIDIARISKDEMGVRPLPVIGEYGQVTPLVQYCERLRLPYHCARCSFQDSAKLL